MIGIRISLTRYLPHARGDEPLCPVGVAQFVHLPHARGDEPIVECGLTQEKVICPTHVGMNRATVDLMPDEAEFAPRTWG